MCVESALKSLEQLSSVDRNNKSSTSNQKRNKRNRRPSEGSWAGRISKSNQTKFAIDQENITKSRSTISTSPLADEQLHTPPPRY